MERTAFAEPMFWASLVVGLVGLPLYVWQSAADVVDDGVRFVAFLLLGLAAFGFGASILIAAPNGTLPPALLLVAAVGSLAGALGAIAIATGLVTGLRIFALVVLIVDGIAIGVTPRAWRAHSRLGVIRAPGDVTPTEERREAVR